MVRAHEVHELENLFTLYIVHNKVCCCAANVSDVGVASNPNPLVARSDFSGRLCSPD
jgi:hypothetical protein